MLVSPFLDGPICRRKNLNFYCYDKAKFKLGHTYKIPFNPEQQTETETATNF